MVEYVPENVIEEMRGSHQPAIFMRVDTMPPLHLRLGGKDIPIGIDAVDADGTVYLGCRLLGMPTLEILINGTADSVEFSLPGIDQDTAQHAIASIPEVRGALVQVGITTLDKYYQPMSAIIPLWNGTASHLRRASPPVQSNQDRTVTLGLVVASGEDGRSRGTQVLWSHAHQVAEYPGDDFFKNMQRLARGVYAVWPNF
jgi:hypothetical protein